MKTKLKPGDIVEITDIHESDVYYKYTKEDSYIGKRGILTDSHDVNTEYQKGYLGLNMIIDNMELAFYAIKLKKVRKLTPKTKKK